MYLDEYMTRNKLIHEHLSHSEEVLEEEEDLRHSKDLQFYFNYGSLINKNKENVSMMMFQKAHIQKSLLTLKSQIYKNWDGTTVADPSTKGGSLI